MRDLGSIPRLGRSPGEGNGHPLQCSGLENSMDCISPLSHKDSDTRERLSLSFQHTPMIITLTMLYVISLSSVAQSCLTLCNPMDLVHGILQARILEWVAFPFSRRSSQLRDEPRSPTLRADPYQLSHKGSPCLWGKGIIQGKGKGIYNLDRNLPHIGTLQWEDLGTNLRLKKKLLGKGKIISFNINING